MTTAPQTRQQFREYVGRGVLERVGVDVSPEFAAALFPRPREKFVTGGWQAGKSYEGAAEIFIDLPVIDLDREYRYWVIVPSYTAPKLEMDYLRQWCEKMGTLRRAHFPEGSSASLSLLGGRVVVETKTAQDPDAIAGEPCDGVLVVEAGQMPESIRFQAQGRIITRRGWITYTGTLEDDEGKPRYAWYGEAAGKAIDNPTADIAGFTLPSWANRTVFPLGRQDPEIVRQERIFDAEGFLRRFAGVPGGHRYPVYPWAGSHGIFDHWEVPEQSRRWIWSLGAGGHDYGQGIDGVSPSTLVAVTVNDRDEAWVREVRRNYSADTEWINSHKRQLCEKYHINLMRWGYDPMQTEAAEQEGAMILRSRDRKVGLIEARANNRRLFFDLSGPGVRECYAQFGRVHYRKVERPGHGFIYEYARVDDDDVAGTEDAIGVIDAPSPLLKAKAQTPWAAHARPRGREYVPA